MYVRLQQGPPVVLIAVNRREVSAARDLLAWLAERVQRGQSVK
jgi:hypothetical protein